MVGLICSNIELNNVDWNTFLCRNKYNLLIYKLKHPEFKSRTRYEKRSVSKDTGPFCVYGRMVRQISTTFSIKS